jgi:plastocyanin
VRVLRLVVCAAVALLAFGPLAVAKAPSGGHGGHGNPNQPAPQAEPTLGNLLKPVTERVQRFVPKAPGTKERVKYYFGPYVVPMGWDANRPDIELPLKNALILSVEPGIREVGTLAEPSHQEMHIHHAHWFGLQPGNEEDNYLGGLTEWIFGNGDEETKANFKERTAADPDGPIYGQHVGAGQIQPMIYMLHNKTAENKLVYIELDMTIVHGSMKQLNALPGRPYHDVSGVLFGRTFDVPRDTKSKDATYETAEDDPRGPIEWKSTVNGTIIGTGGHIHPGGLGVVAENYGSEENPCPDDGKGYGGTQLVRSDTIWHYDVPYTEDFQMEVTNPAWRAPIRKGDRIRISGTYENKKHAWYYAMTHMGFYIDEKQPPQGRCKPYLIGKAAKPNKNGKKPDPTKGVQNRPWSQSSTDHICGEKWGAPPCEVRDRPYVPGPFINQVLIANFRYLPGDMFMSSTTPRVKRGTRLTFVNADQVLNIRHSITTCRWPCNGSYMANYPLADGKWDSDTLGYDIIDGGEPNPRASTPKDLKPGPYSYFCRIHPWMRGAFAVE